MTAVRTWTAWVVLAVATATCGGASPQQGSDQESLPAGFARLDPAGTAPVGLGYLSSIRVVGDGTILMADPTAPAVLRLDLNEGVVDTLGREGDGPEEYRQPDEVFALPGDSTMVLDLGKMRLTYLDATGSFVGGIPMTVPQSSGFPIVMHPRGMDDAGGVYYQARRPDPQRADSAAIVRFDRATERHDTVAWVWTGALQMEGSGGSRRVERRLLSPLDGWAVGPDGSLAVVRGGEYRVDWRLPDGTFVVGDPYPVEGFPITPADQEAELTSFVETGIRTSVLTGPGGIDMRMQRGLRTGDTGPSVDDYSWPETLPVFVPSSPRISPANEVWIERRVPAGATGLLDVFDRAGAHLGDIPLPPDRHLVGFSQDGTMAFLARRDDYGLRWLERYRIVRRTPLEG